VSGKYNVSPFPAYATTEMLMQFLNNMIFRWKRGPVKQISVGALKGVKIQTANSNLQTFELFREPRQALPLRIDLSSRQTNAVVGSLVVVELRTHHLARNPLCR